MRDTPDGAAIDAAVDEALDAPDRNILSLIQSGFPLASRPYAVIGESVGLSEEQTLERVRAMRQRGLIRRIGANFQSAKLGFRSTLCAAKVPQDKLSMFIEAVNAEAGVTHNYLRDHSYNIWFTLISPSWEAVCATLASLTERTGLEIVNLPATSLYKIKVDFQLDA